LATMLCIHGDLPSAKFDATHRETIWRAYHAQHVGILLRNRPFSQRDLPYYSPHMRGAAVVAHGATES
jgi:hypothetical protein